MRAPVLIPGDGFEPSPFPQQQPTRSWGFVRVLVIAWLLAGAGFLLWKRVPEGSGPVTALAVKPEAAAISSEDLVRHMEAVGGKLADAAAKIHRLKDQIDRTIPALDRNDLLVEAQTLRRAATVAESARRELEQSRQEFDLVLNSIRKEDDPK